LTKAIIAVRAPNINKFTKIGIAAKIIACPKLHPTQKKA
jgi:hypothetical protein